MAYKLPFVMAMLKAQVEAMMEKTNLTEQKILEIVTDKELLTDLAHMKPAETEGAARFLAAYIVLSQILFQTHL